MIGFEYYNPAKIVFGEDSEQQLTALLKENHISSLLLVYSGDFIKDLGIYAVIEKAVKELGIVFSENGNVVPNPEVDLVRQLVEQGKKDKVDFVLAVGGGSSIDTAKAVALGIPYDGDVWDFFDKGISPKEVLNIGVIATTASSGSETSNASIISNGEWKIGFEDDRIIPKFAIMNPKYTAGLPLYQTAVGIADVLAHLLERYFSDTQHSDVTDYLIEGGIRALLLNADRLLDDLSDINARAEIQWLASVAHNNFLDAGRSADWGSHRIEHELSAQYHIVHGEGMAVVLLAWIRYVAERKPWRPALLASRVFDVDAHDYDEKERALILAEKLEAFFKSLELKTTLTELGIDDKDFEIMAKRATRNGSVGHYELLDADSIQEILKLAL
ncbi:iron-containing alcohol dehydrogenase [Streptococcus gallolyticus]|uniref:Iron-containing alcohol dehydrogenase n=1 Tax=Streptococcus gallolyticus TaxID=315405 RepID=A0AA94SAT9_9STRE|nr:iron-containing alcohol dehydrogenase [Streptococcus gallolyticus]AQP43251.1 iron-containing alcohol dehydrogenase [Streptococcus gallolyticus subsp. gallolyticus DSM 16831]MCY7151280.1 iron-containing alcohol dehydrogenase [Streptococcus gallolyticus subsp. gallolyticus]MCY7192202.1 iron-containing alcohol dehydrogenase [Streptococcus gallolyticus subsp. gallolyticus]MDO4963969.1 iron-containing alcohol dehydrogenase [Streptococcus gallolyticus]SQG80550.1 iron-containing alcohol dehydrogen